MRYSRFINRCRERSGHLWSNCFYSTPLDESHLWAAVKYVELNPVRARIADAPEDNAWSSARAHASGEIDSLLSPERPFPGPVSNWSEWLAEGLDEETAQRIRQNTYTGRPTGSKSFIERLESRLGRILLPLKRGRKPSRNKGANRKTGRKGRKE